MGHNCNLNCQASRKHYFFTRYIHNDIIGTDNPAGAITLEAPTPLAAVSFTQQKASGPKTINFISNVVSNADSPVGGKVAAADYREGMPFVDQADRNAMFATYLHKENECRSFV
jgi:hypothetical protein